MAKIKRKKSVAREKERESHRKNAMYSKVSNYNMRRGLLTGFVIYHAS
jgi:hypothetical protein